MTMILRFKSLVKKGVIFDFLLNFPMRFSNKKIPETNENFEI